MADDEPHALVHPDDVWRRTDRWIDLPWSTLPPVEGATPFDS